MTCQMHHHPTSSLGPRMSCYLLSGVYLDENLSAFMPSPTAGAPLPRHKYKNRAASSMLVLRGSDAGEANDVQNAALC